MTLHEAYSAFVKNVPNVFVDKFAKTKDGYVFAVKDPDDNIAGAFYYLVKTNGDIENTNPYLAKLDADSFKFLRGTLK